MSMSPAGPEPQESHSYEAASTPRWILVVFVLVFALLGFVVFAGYSARTKLEADLAKANEKSALLTAQMDQTNSRLADIKGQLDVTSQKLGLTQEELARARSMAQSIRKEQKTSSEQLTQQIGQVKSESEAKIGQVSTELGGAKTDIESTKKDLESTKGRLERTVGDLGVQSGLIARNREEVEELKRRGERNIFEFTITKSKVPQRVGPIQAKLDKTDTKKYRYTMTVYADDKSIEKKDKTVNEPVQFYVKGARAPYEIVVFEVSKDKAVGYLSTPKELGAPKPTQ
jgi:chromosome segregation ATPase